MSTTMLWWSNTAVSSTLFHHLFITLTSNSMPLLSPRTWDTGRWIKIGCQRKCSWHWHAIYLLWPPCVAHADIEFLSCFFFFLFSSPNLSGHRLDVYHTSTHGVVLVRIWNAGLKCAARGSLEMQDPKIAKKWPSGRYRTTLSGYTFATKACIGNQKKKTC